MCECKMILVKGRKKRDAKFNGNSMHPDYNIYCGLRYRCSEKGQQSKPDILYSQKKITMSEDWAESFENFLRDMGQRPETKYSIDRIDNNKGYCVHNCRWATKSEQSLNRQATIKDPSWPVGITWNKSNKAFHVRRCLRGYDIRIGGATTLDEAIEMLNKFNENFKDVIN